MKTTDRSKRALLSGYRVLALAILFSLVWHLFWLSAIKVVAAPIQTSQVRFSKVSFLGSILVKVGMEVRSRPSERSFLEKRYVTVFRRPEHTDASGAGSAEAVGYKGPDRVEKGSDGKMVNLIREAVGGSKAEPDLSS